MRRVFNLLITFAFAARSLVPAGAMLVASADYGGRPEIVICTGHGPLSLTFDKSGAPIPSKAPMPGKDVCPYAPVAGVAASTDAPHLLVRTVRYASLTYSVTSEHFRATPRPDSHSARGPPVA